MDIKLGVKGILGFVVGILITVFGWYMVQSLSSILESTALKAIFWIGFVGYWISALILTPVLMSMNGTGEWKGAIKGGMVWFAGTILGIIIYYVGGSVIEAMDAIWPNSTFVGIGWFAIYTIWILGMIVVPIYITIAGSLKKT